MADGEQQDDKSKPSGKGEKKRKLHTRMIDVSDHFLWETFEVGADLSGEEKKIQPSNQEPRQDDQPDEAESEPPTGLGALFRKSGESATEPPEEGEDPQETSFSSLLKSTDEFQKPQKLPESSSSEQPTQAALPPPRPLQKPAASRSPEPDPGMQQDQPSPDKPPSAEPQQISASPPEASGSEEEPQETSFDEPRSFTSPDLSAILAEGAVQASEPPGEAQKRTDNATSGIVEKDPDSKGTVDEQEASDSGTTSRCVDITKPRMSEYETEDVDTGFAVDTRTRRNFKERMQEFWLDLKIILQRFRDP